MQQVRGFLVLTGYCGQWVSDYFLITKHEEWASLVAQIVKNPPAMQENWVWFLSWEDLEEDMATHSNILARRVPIDRGAWQATGHGVTKSWTWLTKHTIAHSTNMKSTVISNWIPPWNWNRNDSLELKTMSSTVDHSRSSNYHKSLHLFIHKSSVQTLNMLTQFQRNIDVSLSYFSLSLDLGVKFNFPCLKALLA